MADRENEVIARLAPGIAAFDRKSWDTLAGGHPFAVRDRAELHRYLALVFTDPPWVPWPADEALARRRAASIDFERDVLARIGGDEAFSLQPRLGQIAAPTLLVWCSDDRVIDVSAESRFRAGLPSSTRRFTRRSVP